MPDLQGVGEMARRINVIAKNFPGRVAQALRQEGEIEMREAKHRTPVDTGTLRASGIVEGPDRNSRFFSVRLSFGGAASTYAIKVHEDLEAFHRVGQAKYLESVINESRPYIGARLAARLNLER